MSFHLRPVQPIDPRPVSPSSSSSTVSDRTPPASASTPAPAPAPAPRPRRPLSPSSLRDVDLTHRPDIPPRKYPAPPTGHELMALFPPAPPLNVRSGPTSGYFQREERAFFAQAGKEIVRVQFELDLPHPDRDARLNPPPTLPSPDAASSSDPEHTTRPLPPPHWHDPHHPEPTTRSLPPVTFSRTSSSRTGMITPIDVQPASRPSQPPPSDPPPYPPRYDMPHLHPDLPPHLSGPAHAHVHPPQDGIDHDAYGGDSDEAWRRPMPHNQRRRAGKHTKRVVVK